MRQTLVLIGLQICVGTYYVFRSVFTRTVVCSYSHIIHVIREIVWIFLFEWAKVSVHSTLEDGWGIAESECHYCRNKGTKRGFERGLVLVLLRNANVVVSGPDIEFRE